MEDPGYRSDQVYVLRHTFQPNEPLREALAKLVTTGSQGARHFSIYGSDRQIVDMAQSRSHEFHLQLREADAFLGKRATSHLLLEGKIEGFLVRGQPVGGIALRLLMKPEMSPEYTQVRSALDLIKVGNREKVGGLEDGMLYTTFPQEQLRPLGEVKERLADLNRALGTTATRRLYGVIPSTNLVGRPALRKLTAGEGMEYPEIHAS